MAPGRVKMTVEQRKKFVLRLYPAILQRYKGGYKGRYKGLEGFKKELIDKKAKVRESTVRSWLPPLTRLNEDPVRGSKVRVSEWEKTGAPDVVTLVEVSIVLDISIDYLLGFDVRQTRSDREVVGGLVDKETLARALVSYVAGRCVESVGDSKPLPGSPGIATVGSGKPIERWEVTRQMAYISALEEVLRCRLPEEHALWERLAFKPTQGVRFRRTGLQASDLRYPLTSLTESTRPREFLESVCYWTDDAAGRIMRDRLRDRVAQLESEAVLPLADRQTALRAAREAVRNPDIGAPELKRILRKFILSDEKVERIAHDLRAAGDGDPASLFERDHVD